MAKVMVQQGLVLDGFTIGECVHRGGMATLWTVSHPDIASPLLIPESRRVRIRLRSSLSKWSR